MTPKTKTAQETLDRDLLFSIADNLPDLALLAISKGADILCSDDLGRTPLMYLSSASDPSSVETLMPVILAASDPRTVDSEGLDALSHAASAILPACAEASLIAAKTLVPLADLDHCDSQGNSALHHSILSGNVPVLREILSARPELSLPDKHSNPAHIAAYHGQAEAFEAVYSTALSLISHAGIPHDDICRNVTEIGRTHLHAAAISDNPDTVLRVLAVTGLDPDCVDDLGNTPAMLAANRGIPGTLAILLPLTDPLIPNREGRTLLSLAESSGSQECVEMVASLIHSLSMERELPSKGNTPSRKKASV